MRRAASSILGTHDFTSFCRPIEGDAPSPHDPRGPLSIAGHRFRFDITADRFSTDGPDAVGTMVDVEGGTATPATAPDSEARDWREAGPPHPGTVWSPKSVIERTLEVRLFSYIEAVMTLNPASTAVLVMR